MQPELTIQQTGKDAQEWLERWDRGDTVWSINMSGFGGGYEQCCQLMGAEALRWYLAHHPTDEQLVVGSDASKAYHKQMVAEMMEAPAIRELMPSGAQFGAACSFGWIIFKRGPFDALNDPNARDGRLIEVSKAGSLAV